ncbi:MAG: hydantoinase/oxoprolinase family protein [Hyphomicrobiaceae bacterium]|nr:hydantoinase/oxoprolinase family protein [Hyphomicrobiaceae bacterium]
MTAAWLLGIDIGGTFTDVVAVERKSNALRTGKVLSDPSDPMSALVAACESVNLKLDDIHDIVHGTTMATNAIVEGRLPPIALVATEGFAEALDIGRQNRRELYKMEVTPRPEPLVPRRLRIEARERIDAQGDVITELTEAEIERLTREIAALGVEAVAISLLHSYLNGEHETRLGAALCRVVPHIALSHQLNPEPREYERTNATAMNAALMPLIARYLDRLVGKIGSLTALHMFHSAGGMASAASIASRPLALALSGPAAGVAAAAAVARQLELPSVISFDMGGTTTDVSVIVDGKVQIDSNQRIAGYPIRQMMVSIETIGAGGGSIARRDGKAVRVGPDSAGAAPGPACYGLGGTQPTVADANILLGYIDPRRRLGGSVRLDVGKAATAFEPLAAAFGTSIHETALGVRRVANANMARALRRVTIEHGIDARSCSLLAFGGAGPMHAVSLAREFGISKIIVPRFSSAFSAFGCLTAEMSYAEQRPLHMNKSRWSAESLQDSLGRMRDRLSEPLIKAGCPADTLQARAAGLLRYAGQSDTVEVPLDAPYDLAVVDAAFKAAHERLFGFATDEDWEVDTIRVTVSAPPMHHADSVETDGTGGKAEPRMVRKCWFEGGVERDTPCFDRNLLPRDWRCEGPAIIEDSWSTIVVDPGATVWVGPFEHLHIAAEGC